MNTHYKTISQELGITEEQVENTSKLLAEGATIPFIARYRKEMTGSLNEIILIKIRDRLDQLQELDSRRETILRSIEEQGKLTRELKDSILNANTIHELEDIYLPYKPKKKTRAGIARKKGLEPLAKIIMNQGSEDPAEKAISFINEEKKVHSVEDALQGSRDIIAEWINENRHARNRIRKLFIKEGIITSKKSKSNQEKDSKYEDYFNWQENLAKAPSHRILAMFRGEKEKKLTLNLQPDKDKAHDILHSIFIRLQNACSEQVSLAIEDAYKRLLLPSIENEIRQSLKERADEEAIKVFTENLQQLLLAPPLGRKNILAIDPGFRTGCKVVCLDQNGNLKHNETIYPHPPENKVKEATKKIRSLVNAYKIEAIAIGNGTAGRETERFIKSIAFEKDIIAVMVNESGASVYSASNIGREEFPDYDVTVRGAVSIGRRLMDPLSELVKIDPKSIGVGQYQHDVNQNMLQQSLSDTVVNSVNAVGVSVNTASKELLTHVSGLGESLAKNIVSYRKSKGAFQKRQDFLKVPRFGPKAFEQAAGFLRIENAQNPLDASAVHPESYSIVEKMAKDQKITIQDLIGKKELQKNINLKHYITPQAGLPTLKDIMDELAKPGRDPRKQFEVFEFDKNIHTINDLKKGMKLPGLVTNITKFGVFVDIGVHHNGLIHISELSSKQFIKDPAEIVKLNEKLIVEVLDVDLVRNRISLSTKSVK